MREYFIKDNQGNLINSTLSEDMMSVYLSCTVQSEKISINKKTYRHGIINDGNIAVYIITDEHDFVSSTHLFRTLLNIYVNCAIEIDKVKKELLLNILHELTSINARMIQEAFLFLSPEDLNGDYNHQFELIQNKILENIEDAVNMFNRICKNNNSLKSKLLSLKALHNIAIKLRNKKTKIRPVVLRACHDHFTELKELDVIMNIEEADDDFILDIDFDTFFSALDPFLENTVKYVLPNSKIIVSFTKQGGINKIIFNMMSLKIEDQEKEKIFEYRYSGFHAKKEDLSGQGIGLYVSNKLLFLNNAKWKLIINKGKNEKYLNKSYQNNIFEIIFND